MVTIVSTAYAVTVSAGTTINAVLAFAETHVLCTVTPDIVVPAKLPPMGAFYPEYDIKLHFTHACKLGWVPYPKSIFPIEVTVAFNSVPFTRTINSSADLDYNYASTIKSLISNGKITDKPLKVEVTYPKYIRYYLLTGRKTIDTETESFSVETGLAPPTPIPTPGIPTPIPTPGIPTPIPTPGIPTPIPTPEPTGLPIICNPSLSSLTTPGSIPITLPDPTDLMSSPTLDLSTFNIVGAVSVPCVQNSSSASVPTNLFPMGMNLTIDDGKSDHTGLVTIERAGIFTEDVARIIRDWMSTKTATELVKLSGIKLILRYYGTVTFADATATGVGTETKRVEKYVPLNIPTAEIPIPIPTPVTPIPIPTPEPIPTPITPPTQEPITPSITPQTGLKRVYATTPLLTRSGKRTQIVGLVYCGTKRVGGEKAWISINGELLTTANTRDGKVTAEWTPLVPGLYTICITVPASSACNASANGCTMMQVVSELSQADIAIAEKEFESAKKRVGEIMERL